MHGVRALVSMHRSQVAATLRDAEGVHSLLIYLKTTVTLKLIASVYSIILSRSSTQINRIIDLVYQTQASAPEIATDIPRNKVKIP